MNKMYHNCKFMYMTTYLFIDPKLPKAGPTGRPKGRKFGDASRWKSRKTRK